MARESAVRSRIAALLQTHGFFTQSIESETTPGLPDMYWRFDKDHSGWVEFKKVTKIPARDTTSLFESYNHPLLLEQQNWFTEELKRGGTADIIVAWERKYFLVPGSYHLTFNSFTLSRLHDFEVARSDIHLKLLRKTPVNK